LFLKIGSVAVGFESKTTVFGYSFFFVSFYDTVILNIVHGEQSQLYDMIDKVTWNGYVEL